MVILGIESTCDETGAAVVEDGSRILTNQLATSISKLVKFGGVVPEIAAREQLKVIIPTLELALKTVPLKKIDAIAVSSGPGLIGSLLIGVESAKAISLAWEKPLIPVDHLAAHIYSNWLDRANFPRFPLVGLVVSGGHTDLIYMKKHGDFRLLGSTLDDAAGEAFDKTARSLGLPYPGGPEIEHIARTPSIVSAKNGRAKNQFLPRPMVNSEDFNFSFSGLKTAIAVKAHEKNLSKTDKGSLAFEFQEAIVDSIYVKVVKAIETFRPKSFVVGGGVAANSRLRDRLNKLGDIYNIKVYFPLNHYSVDNGAMIASAAFFTGRHQNPLSIQPNSGLHFD